MLLPCVENVGILQLFSIISRSLKYLLFSNQNFTSKVFLSFFDHTNVHTDDLQVRKEKVCSTEESITKIVKTILKWLSKVYQMSLCFAYASENSSIYFPPLKQYILEKRGLESSSSSKSPLKEKEILLEMQTSFSSLNCFAMAAKLKLLKAAAGKRGRRSQECKEIMSKQPKIRDCITEFSSGGNLRLFRQS